MKRMCVWLAALTLVWTGCGSNGEEEPAANILEAIPDPAFREYCTQFDTNEDGILSPWEANQVDRLELSNLGIKSLDGIEYFTKIKFLFCDNLKNEEGVVVNPNELTSLDVEKNTELRSLACSGNQLTQLDVSQNTKLLFLGCAQNRIQQLNVSANQLLQTLLCSGNDMQTLTVSVASSKNTNLIRLECADNHLTTLKIDLNTNLLGVDCSNNRLTSLPLSYNKALQVLNCSGNQLSGLSLEENPELVALSCGENALTELDISNNPKLEQLWCIEAPRLSVIYVWEDFDLANPTLSIPEIRPEGLSIFRLKPQE